jgi:hypothetical protein
LTAQPAVLLTLLKELQKWLAADTLSGTLTDEAFVIRQHLPAQMVCACYERVVGRTQPANPRQGHIERRLT